MKTLHTKSFMQNLRTRALSAIATSMLLSSSLCHAWLPLPTSRDLTIATAASVGTFALVRTYYLGQERRITAAIRTENDATRAAILHQGQETRNVVETAGQTVVTAVESTHADVRRVGTQAGMLLNQNEDLAKMLYALHIGQQRILANQQRQLSLSGDTENNLIEDTQPSSSQPPLKQHYPVQITALATKIQFPRTNNLQNLPFQTTASVPLKEPVFPTMRTFRAQGSTQDTSFGARLGDGFSTIKNIFWKNDQD